jgi:hypothetical protein
MFQSQNQRIVSLRAQVAELEAEKEALEDAREQKEIRQKAEIEAIQDETLTMLAARDKASRLLAERTKEAESLKAELAAKNGKLATFEGAVETAVQAKFAELGGEPIPEAGSRGDVASTGLTGLALATAAHVSQSQKSK